MLRFSPAAWRSFAFRVKQQSLKTKSDTGNIDTIASNAYAQSCRTTTAR